jgi:hypothetical protein
VAPESHQSKLQRPQKCGRAGLAERASCQEASEHDRDETYRKNLQATVALTSAVDALQTLEQENIKIVRCGLCEMGLRARDFR